MLEKDEKLILSMGVKKHEFNIRNFFNKVDKVISSKKHNVNENDDIRILSTDGSEKIYIDPLSEKLESGLSGNNQIILGYSEELELPQYNSSLIRTKIEKNKKVEQDIFQENTFTNRKQKFAAKKVEVVLVQAKTVDNEVSLNKQEDIKITNESNDLITKEDSIEVEENKVDKIIADKLLKHEALNELVKDYTDKNENEESNTIDLDLINKVAPEDENSFEEGLKARLSLIAEEKLHEFALTPEEKITKCNEYYMKVLYPLFTDLEEGLALYNRKANVNINTFMISLDVRYQDKIEYKYQVTILDTTNYPILEIMISDLSGELVVRDGLTNTSIDKVTHQDIFQDFLSSYKNHISQINAKDFG